MININHFLSLLGQCSQCKMQKELWKYLHSLFQCSDVDLLKEISVELNFLGNLKQKCCCQFCLGSCLGLFAHIIILDLERQHCRGPLHFNMRTKNRGRGRENDICLYQFEGDVKVLVQYIFSLRLSKSIQHPCIHIAQCKPPKAKKYRFFLGTSCMMSQWVGSQNNSPVVFLTHHYPNH